MAERGILAFLIILLTVLVFAQPYLAWPVRHMFERSAGLTDANKLAIDNESLRAENAILRERNTVIPPQFSSEKEANVFVRYPFNYKKELLIDIGKNSDVKEGDTVLLPDTSSGEKRGILVGRVESVQDKTSLVQLIFDSRLRIGVRIGDQGVEALLTGGDTPKLTLIPKSAQVGSGNIVYAASANLPYGVVIGEIKDVSLADGGLLQEATLRFPYELSDIKTVVVTR